MGYDIKEGKGDVNGLSKSFRPHKALTVRYGKGETGKILYCPSVKDVQGFRLTPKDKRVLAKRIRTLWEGRPNKKASDDGVAIPFARARELLFPKNGNQKSARRKRK